MRYRALLHLLVVIVILLVTLGVSINFSDVQEKARNILGSNPIEQIKQKFKQVSATRAPEPKCSLSTLCPADHFAVHIRSGAANVVGPKICFEGKIIMSHVMNNVGVGLNIVLVNGESGVVEKLDFLNMIHGNQGDILAYLKNIKAGRIVLVASFDDVTPKMTDEMREVFVQMGSTLIKSVRRRDGWVFAGQAGLGNRTLFEKQAVNDEKTNIYEGWPGLVEVGGCFPKTLNDGRKP